VLDASGKLPALCQIIFFSVSAFLRWNGAQTDFCGSSPRLEILFHVCAATSPLFQNTFSFATIAIMSQTIEVTVWVMFQSDFSQYIVIIHCFVFAARGNISIVVHRSDGQGEACR
jgi:hypothetical protein